MRPEANAVSPLRRHQVAFLTADGWADALQHVSDDIAGELRRWAKHGLPLVVTQQGVVADTPGRVALGWPAPLACGRRRVAVNVRRDGIARRDEFPLAAAAIDLLPADSREAMRSLLCRLERLGTPARVYGSYGWQQLSGLDYVHARSDLDLWLAVHDLAHADRIVALLAACAVAWPRIDGELIGPDGTAVAWREYEAWRAGRVRGVLVKRLDRAAIEARPGWPDASTALAA
ncbi:MAG: malonate decarboxylase holo-[acyl-carrier-protein] synthase [Caldimonas sp.]